MFLPCVGRSLKSLSSNLAASALFSGERGFDRLSTAAVIVTASLMLVFILTLTAGGGAAPTVISNATASKFFACRFIFECELRLGDNRLRLVLNDAAQCNAILRYHKSKFPWLPAKDVS